MKKIITIAVSTIVAWMLIASLMGWYYIESQKVLSLGDKPSPVFCRVSSWVGYYGLDRLERRVCERLLQPPEIKPVDKIKSG